MRAGLFFPSALCWREGARRRGRVLSVVLARWWRRRKRRRRKRRRRKGLCKEEETQSWQRQRAERGATLTRGATPAARVLLRPVPQRHTARQGTRMQAPLVRPPLSSARVGQGLVTAALLLRFCCCALLVRSRHAAQSRGPCHSVRERQHAGPLPFAGTGDTSDRHVAVRHLIKTCVSIRFRFRIPIRPSPTLSPTGPVPRGLLILWARAGRGAMQALACSQGSDSVSTPMEPRIRARGCSLQRLFSGAFVLGLGQPAGNRI